MSQQLFGDDVLFLQRFLSSLGLYTDTLDGGWGPRTDAAYNAFLARCDAIATAEGTTDGAPRPTFALSTLPSRSSPGGWCGPWRGLVSTPA